MAATPLEASRDQIQIKTWWRCFGFVVPMEGNYTLAKQSDRSFSDSGDLLD